MSSTFQNYDQKERELFTAFTNAIRDSHEKQRAQGEYTKYFGLVLSIAGSFLAFVYTTIKKQDIKVFIEEKLASIDFSKNDANINLDLTNDPVMKDLIRINQQISAEMRVNRRILTGLTDVLNKQIKYNDSQNVKVAHHDSQNVKTSHHDSQNVKASLHDYQNMKTSGYDFQNMNTRADNTPTVHEVLQEGQNLGYKVLGGLVILYVLSKMF